jgi:hypothetical protein
MKLFQTLLLRNSNILDSKNSVLSCLGLFWNRIIVLKNSQSFSGILVLSSLEKHSQHLLLFYCYTIGSSLHMIIRTIITKNWFIFFCTRCKQHHILGRGLRRESKIFKLVFQQWAYSSRNRAYFWWTASHWCYD